MANTMLVTFSYSSTATPHVTASAQDITNGPTLPDNVQHTADPNEWVIYAYSGNTHFDTIEIKAWGTFSDFQWSRQYRNWTSDLSSDRNTLTITDNAGKNASAVFSVGVGAATIDPTIKNENPPGGGTLPNRK